MGQQVVEGDGSEWMKGGFRADGLLLLRMGAILGMPLELEAELSGL